MIFGLGGLLPTMNPAVETPVTRASLANRAARLTTAMPAHTSERAISFDSGHACPAVLPDLTQEADRALTEYRSETLQYAPRPGLPELRAWIAEYMRGDGVPDVSADGIQIVNGAKHGLELICRLLLDEGDSIVVTAPTYFTAIPIFKSLGVRFIEIPQDASGLDVEILERVLEQRRREGAPLPKFIYDVPDFHNPTGKTMPRKRREALLDAALRHGVFVVEDSPYRKVRFEGTSEPSLKALDPGDIVLALGTFSKLLAPGLRIGWITAARDLLTRIMQLKSDGGSCPLTQRLILEFAKAGHLDTHMRRVQEIYREHRDRMIAALRRELPQAETVIPQGGYYVWLTLPAGINDEELATRAAQRDVIVLPGSKFFAEPDGRYASKNHMRLAYSHASPEEIDAGVARLAEALRSM